MFHISFFLKKLLISLKKNLYLSVALAAAAAPVNYVVIVSDEQ